MISVHEAKEIVSNSTPELAAVKTVLSEADGKVLAEDVLALVDIPAFPQSSMDGYAFSFEGWKKHKKLKIAGEVAAGSNETFTLTPAKKALGSFENKNILNFTGCFINFINAGALGFIIVPGIVSDQMLLDSSR